MKISTLILSFLLAFHWANAKTEPVTIQGAVGTLHGVVTTPDTVKKSQKIPTVIIFHGLTSNKDKKLYVTLADSLAAHGIASVRFDFNGHGESEGDFKKMSLDNELEDARRIMAFTKKLPFVGKIGLIGHSQGGAIAMLLSAELGKKSVKALGLLAPASTIHDILSQGVLFDATFDPLNVPEELSFFGGKVTVGKDYILSAQRCKLIEKASTYKGNVLVIHGTGDRMISYTYSENLPFFYKHCKVSLIERGDHLFTAKEAQTAEMMTQFMLKNLR